MSKLILIRGNSASGKTTLAKALQAELGENTLLLSQDELRRHMLIAHDGFDTPTIPLLQNLLTYGYKNCQYVILEGILRSDWYEPVWKTILELYGQNVFAYYSDLSFEDTLIRHASREKSKEFGADALKRWWNDKDYLDQIHEKKIYADGSLENNLERILNDIAI